MNTQPTAAPAGTEQTPEPGDTTTTTAATEQPPKPPKPAPKPPPPPPVTSTAAEQSDYDKGIAAERTRIAALQKYDKPSTHAIIVQAIADGKTVADVTDELFAALEKPVQQSARHADAQNLSMIRGSDTTPGAEGADDNFSALLVNAVKSQLKARGQSAVLRQSLN